MHALFVNVLNASFYGSIMLAAVLLLRLALKRAPRSIVCLLWVLVGLRLLCPFQLESRFSLQPRANVITQPQLEAPRQEMMPAIPEDVVFPEDVEIVISDAIGSTSEPAGIHSQQIFDWTAVVAWIWLAGVCSLGLHGLLSYLRLKYRVREAVRTERNIYECAGLDTAFILGYFRPRIYLPTELEQADFILNHERSHIRRGDHWFKLIGFTALAIHWFNPLMWAGYLLLCRDLETACDEAVVRDLSLEQRKAYSAALLACAAHRSGISACPVAFGEVSVKARIINILNYRKPRFWICLIAVAAIVFVAVCFLTNPADPSGDTGTASPSSHLEPAEALNWAQNLKVEDVEKIELLVDISRPNEQYHCYDRDVYGRYKADIVALINGSNGQYVEETQKAEHNLQCLTLMVTMTDGTRHILRNEGYTYLEIDGYHYEADYDWLSTWPNQGTSPSPDASLERCRLALEEFQSRDSYFLLTESHFSGDIVSNSATRFDYRSGSDWVLKHETTGTDQSNVAWYMEIDGTRYVRSHSVIHDPLNGEGGDTGWEMGKLEVLPWLDTFDMDTAEIQFIQAACGDEEDIVIFTVQGCPYPDDDKCETMGYAVTFRFTPGTNTLRSVTLQYTEMWPMISNEENVMGTGHIVSTIYPQEMAPEDVAAFIDQCYQEAKSQT
ncbi:MAG: M56 family metallopeptidase [Oscillospiraceae bacterium]|nr:M56 family metallopeptidase [Oscillospiraceae bacterium]